MPKPIDEDDLRNNFVDQLHFLLPDIRLGETAESFRARCQVEIGEMLYKHDLLCRLTEGIAAHRAVLVGVPPIDWKTR